MATLRRQDRKATAVGAVAVAGARDGTSLPAAVSGLAARAHRGGHGSPWSCDLRDDSTGGASAADPSDPCFGGPASREFGCITPAKVVQEMLGHSTVGITLGLYAHVLPGMQRQAAENLDRLLGETAGSIQPPPGPQTSQPAGHSPFLRGVGRSS
jgi:hypothetical protein